MVHSCNFCFGGREASSEMEPLRDPLPKELGELECRFPPSILQPSSYFPPPPDPFSPPPAAPCRPPVGPQPRSSPASSSLAPGQPPSLAAGGDGWRRRPKVKGGEPAGLGPLCALGSAPPPPALSSLTPRRAPALVTFPGVGNCISGPLKTPASGPVLKNQRARGGAPRWGGVPSWAFSWSWGHTGIPSSPRLERSESVAPDRTRHQPTLARQSPAVPRIQVRPI